MKSRLVRYIPPVLILAGMGLIIFALAADVLGFGGKTGFGAKQILIAAIGALVFALGVSGAGKSGGARVTNFLNKLEMVAKTREQPFYPDNRQALFKLIMLTSIWFGLLTGFVEAAYYVYTRYVLADVIILSQHFIWMIPVADLLLAIVLGLGIFVAALALPKIGSVRMISLVLLFGSVMALFSIRPNLHILASLLLSLGLAFQISAIIGARSVSFYRLVQRTTPWFVIFLCVLIAGWVGYYL